MDMKIYWMTWSIWMLLAISTYFGVDTIMAIFAFAVFVACGVPWELVNWRTNQEFSNGEEIIQG